MTEEEVFEVSLEYKKVLEKQLGLDVKLEKLKNIWEYIIKWIIPKDVWDLFEKKPDLFNSRDIFTFDIDGEENGLVRIKTSFKSPLYYITDNIIPEEFKSILKESIDECAEIGKKINETVSNFKKEACYPGVFSKHPETYNIYQEIKNKKKKLLKESVEKFEKEIRGLFN